EHRATIRRHLAAIAASVAVGCATGILSALACAVALRATRVVVLSVLSKSVTTPITIEVARALGGSPELAAVVTVLTGLAGAILVPPMLRVCGPGRDLPMG